MVKPLLFLVAGMIAGSFLVLALPALSQEGGDPHARYGRDVPATPEAQAAMMKRWQESMTPGRFHERLSYFVGEWKTVTKMWMGGAGSGEPATSSGKATYRWLMEGRWLAQDFSGDMMGIPFTGFALTGYDNFRKQYTGTWIDSMSTALATMEGGIDRTGKRIEMFGKLDEPMLDQAGKSAKYVTQIVDDDHFTFELHDLDIIGGETKVLGIAYERLKK
jgi:hypothetical protein